MAWCTSTAATSSTTPAGKFKSPVGLERLQSASDIRFVSRGYPTSLAPNRDLGLQVGGNLLEDSLTYQVAFLNGSNDGGSSEAFADADVNDDKEWAFRLFSHPFAGSDNFYLRGLGIGVAGTMTDQKGSNTQTLLPSFRTPANQTFFSYRGAAAAAGTTPASNATIQDGDRSRIAPQLYWHAGSFGLLSEYITVATDVSRQVALSWFATGEEASFRGFTPNSVFTPGGAGWGAVELVARYQELDVDDASFTGGALSFANPATSSSAATSIGAGANWYLNKNLKVALEYENTSFKGGATGGAAGITDRDDENAVLTRVQLNF